MGVSRLDGEELDVNVEHVHGRALNRQRADMAGLDAVSVHEAGHFDACFLRQVGDQVTRIENVAADLVGRVGHNGFHDMGRILPGALVSLDAGLEELCVFFLPGLDLVDAAAGVLIQRNVVAVDELGIAALDVEAVVLRIMLTGFCYIVAEIADVIEAHLVLEVGLRHLGLDAGLDLGIQIVAVLVLDLQKPCHMVDACDQFLSAFQLVLKADAGQKILGADLHAVAEADGLHACIALHVAGQHSHGVGVVEKESVRADLLHIPGKILHDRDGPERAHDAADSQCVGNSLAKAVLLGDLEVDDGRGIITAYLDRVDDEGGAAERGLAILYAEIALDLSIAAQHFAHGFQDRAALLKPCPVDIIQCENAVPQRFAAHAVSNDISCENGASRTHKCDLHCKSPSFYCFLV